MSFGRVNTGGINTNDATAQEIDILAGKTAYARGEKITGVYEPLNTDDATAGPADILKDKTAYAGGKKIVGTLDVASTINGVKKDYYVYAGQTVNAGDFIKFVNGVAYAGEGGAGGTQEISAAAKNNWEILEVEVMPGGEVIVIYSEQCINKIETESNGYYSRYIRPDERTVNVAVLFVSGTVVTSYSTLAFITSSTTMKSYGSYYMIGLDSYSDESNYTSYLTGLTYVMEIFTVIPLSDNIFAIYFSEQCKFKVKQLLCDCKSYAFFFKIENKQCIQIGYIEIPKDTNYISHSTDGKMAIKVASDGNTYTIAHSETTSTASFPEGVHTFYSYGDNKMHKIDVTAGPFGSVSNAMYIRRIKYKIDESAEQKVSIESDTSANVSNSLYSFVGGYFTDGAFYATFLKYYTKNNVWSSEYNKNMSKWFLEGIMLCKYNVTETAQTLISTYKTEAKATSWSDSGHTSWESNLRAVDGICMYAFMDSVGALGQDGANPLFSTAYTSKISDSAMAPIHSSKQGGNGLCYKKRYIFYYDASTSTLKLQKTDINAMLANAQEGKQLFFPSTSSESRGIGLYGGGNKQPPSVALFNINAGVPNYIKNFNVYGLNQKFMDYVCRTVKNKDTSLFLYQQNADKKIEAKCIVFSDTTNDLGYAAYLFETQVAKATTNDEIQGVAIKGGKGGTNVMHNEQATVVSLFAVDNEPH